MRSAHRRTAAVGGAVALVGVVGVGAAIGAPTAPRQAGVTGSPSARQSAPSPGSSPVTSVAVVPAPAAAPVAVARGRSRLALTVTPGRTLAVVGVLTRAASGAAVGGRRLKVYVRTADTGRWQRATSALTSNRGRIAVRIPDRPLLQITLRFEGDRWYGPAASVTVVPDPSATAMRPGLLRALARAQAAAKRAGLTLVLNSGYRTWAKQQRLYDAAVRRYGSPRVARRWVLPPQESTHVRGLAADIGTPATAAWLGRHGAALGLCRTYGDEPWHFEYRPDWVAALHGSCPPPVPLPGDPDPFSPRPRVAVVF